MTVGGMCKGSGMIHPNMCTMLAFVTTDAAISKELLQERCGKMWKILLILVSVDGDTSTNDTLVVLANGLAGNPDSVTDGTYAVGGTSAAGMAAVVLGFVVLLAVTLTHLPKKEGAK